MLRLMHTYFRKNIIKESSSVFAFINYRCYIRGKNIPGRCVKVSHLSMSAVSVVKNCPGIIYSI